MPFVTEFNTSLILKKIIGDIPEDIREWSPYKKPIYFLNRLDKTNLLYFKKFCENPIEFIDKVYNPIELIDKKQYVFEGGKPSYHKFETCEKLSSNFINFKIPDLIKSKGSEAIEEYRRWFKENQGVFIEKPEIYQMRLLSKYGIVQRIEKVEYHNSGNVYKENLTLANIETRIESILHHAALYFKQDEKRQKVLRRFQTATFLAFNENIIEPNDTGYNDIELKAILKEYYYLFIEPTIFYLKEYFRISYNSNIEINESIFEALNFKKCNVCYADDYELKTKKTNEKRKNLIDRFGNFDFPIEPTIISFKENESAGIRIAFIYCIIYRCIDIDLLSDEIGIILPISRTV